MLNNETYRFLFKRFQTADDESSACLATIEDNLHYNKLTIFTKIKYECNPYKKRMRRIHPLMTTPTPIKITNYKDFSFFLTNPRLLQLSATMDDLVFRSPANNRCSESSFSSTCLLLIHKHAHVHLRMCCLL